jgi:hypothetical protein
MAVQISGALVYQVARKGLPCSLDCLPVVLQLVLDQGYAQMAQLVGVIPKELQDRLETTDFLERPLELLFLRNHCPYFPTPVLLHPYFARVSRNAWILVFNWPTPLKMYSLSRNR